MDKRQTTPWAWIPTLYMAEGAPYFAVNTLAMLFLSEMGLSNTDVALYTSWMYLPWVIKPFWSPILDLFGSKKMWVVVMQFIVAIALGGVAFTAPCDFWLNASLAFFWLCAFASATHDIAADGLYILALDTNQQSFFVGIRNTFYRISTVLCQWGCLVLAGQLFEQNTVDGMDVIPAHASAWSTVFYIMAIAFLFLSVYHFAFLPNDKKRLEIGRTSDDEMLSVETYGRTSQNETDAQKTVVELDGIVASLKNNFKSFFAKFTGRELILALLFIFTYRLGEAQLGKIAQLFLKDTYENGGLGLSLTDVGNIYGLVGVIALMTGGVLGGIAVSRYGLKKMMFPMLLFMNIPNVVYIFLSSTQTAFLPTIYTMVAIEQFGYGFGFTAFTLYLVYISQGKYSTTHYAICTGLMALGMMIPGMIAGYMQETLGYTNFFVWVCICTIPPFFIAPLLKIDKEFGVK
ncbi:MAG: MFS transporter [Paludibacteraceae bacterium]|nr:MFS transporter [Paludibacteraceae bacterium]